MSVLDSIVVEYTDESGTTTGDGKLANDDERNREEQGIADETVSPSPVTGYDYHILCQLPVGYVIDSIVTTDSQAINNGLTTREWKEEKVFFPNTDKHKLSFRASGATIWTTHYGALARDGVYTMHDYIEISNSNPPSISDITYMVQFYSITIKATDKKNWPIGIVIKAVQV